MKISHNDLMTIEEQRHIITVQSDYPEIAYAIDRHNNTLWIINRQTGAQLEVSGENVYKFADEMLSVAELHLGVKGLHKAS
jgi:hypothetical protein